MEEKGEKQAAPLLLLQYGPLLDRKQCVCNVLEKGWDRIMIPMLCDQFVLPCNYGWLVLLNPYTNTCNLWNPESRQLIRLPELQKSYLYSNCVLSKPPTEPGCHILFNSASPSKQAFCRIGDDEFMEMSTHDNDDVDCIETLTSFRGEIYAVVGFKLRLMIISFVGKTLQFRPILKSGQPWNIFQSLQPCSTDEVYYLIDDDDKMLLVCRMCPAFYLRQFCDFRVFQIDISGLECVELVDIGKRAIFLSNKGDAFCCSSVGMKSNSIYYTFGGRSVYVYNLGKRATTTLLPCPAADRVMSEASWIQHSFSMT